MILVGFMVDNRKSLKTVKKYLIPTDLEISLFSFTPKDINWLERTIAGVAFCCGKWVKENFPFPDAIYNRCYIEKPIVERLNQELGPNKLFNCINRFDKWKVYQVLRQTDIAAFLPRTELLAESDWLEKTKPGESLFIKPVKGLKGKNVYRIEMNLENKLVLYHESLSPRMIFDPADSFLLKLKEMTKNKQYIIQEEIKMAKMDNRMFDIRILVQKNLGGEWEVSASLSRIAIQKFYITNIYTDITHAEYPLKKLGFFSERILDKLHEVSLRVAGILEQGFCCLGEISVDFGIDEEGRSWLIEVNGKPDKSMFNKLNDTEAIQKIYSRPIEFAYYLSQQ